MSLKERVEENAVLWLLGFLVTGFLSGIGTYKTILEIAQLTVVPKSAEVVGLRREVEKLRSENQRLRDEKRKSEKPEGKTDPKIGELSTYPPEPARGTSNQSPARDIPAPRAGKDQGTLAGKFSGTIVLKDGSETQCRDISFREMHFNVFQYWWDPDKVKSLTEMSFENIQSLQPGPLRKVDNVSPDFIEIRLTRIDGKVITVYSSSNYEFYCGEEGLPEAAAFPMTQVKEVKISPVHQSKGYAATGRLTPSDVLPVLLHNSTSLATMEMINKFKASRCQWTGIVADVRSSPSGEVIVDLLHEVDQQRVSSYFSQDQMRWWKDRWRDTQLYLRQDQRQKSLSLSKGDSLLYSGNINAIILETPVCCLVIKDGEVIKRAGVLKK
ncbi:MAG TPA: hypothetical protein VGM86_09310 [Thermoanaerobaculia bacterium]|jgi:hypothetical protein